MRAHHIEFDEQDSYALFARAIKERDSDAWGTLSTRYRPVLIAWAIQYSARTPVSEPCDELADQAFARAWMALSPDRFAGFSCLAALMGYLRTCVMAAVLDSVRAAHARERGLRRLTVGWPATPEQIVLGALERVELWRLVGSLAKTEAERTILLESFVNGLQPRAIQLRHADLFADVSTIYRVKQNLLDRLRRHPEIQQVCQELGSM
jgi:hypothetical protein